MTVLKAALADYLALRRSLGYKLERGSELLTDFVAYLDQQGADHVTVEARHHLGDAACEPRFALAGPAPRYGSLLRPLPQCARS